MKIRILLSVFVLLVALPATANAASCQSKAARLAASNNGSVLSVRSSGAKCRIKILIRPAKGPPKQKTFVVSK